PLASGCRTRPPDPASESRGRALVWRDLILVLTIAGYGRPLCRGVSVPSSQCPVLVRRYRAFSEPEPLYLRTGWPFLSAGRFRCGTGRTCMPRIPGGERPAPGSGQSGDQAITEAAVRSPALGSQPQRPALDSAPASSAGDDAPPRNWLLRKKTLTPVVLAVISVALGLIAWAVYPSRTQLPVPTYTTLHLISNIKINTITYRVYQ